MIELGENGVDVFLQLDVVGGEEGEAVLFDEGKVVGRVDAALVEDPARGE